MHGNANGCKPHPRLFATDQSAAVVLLPHSWALRELFDGEAVKEQPDGSMALDRTLLQSAMVDVRKNASDAPHGVVLHGLAHMGLGVSQLFAPANGKIFFTKNARLLTAAAHAVASRRDVSSLDACERALQQLQQQAQQPDAYIDMYCAAYYNGCPSGLRLAWQLSDLLWPALLPGESGAGVVTAWLPTLVIGGHYQLTPLPQKPGIFSVSTHN
jgi:hypothetical protein